MKTAILKVEIFRPRLFCPCITICCLENDKKKTAANLVNLIRDNNYNIKTGFPGTPYVLFALADNGYLEDAYKMLLADTCLPGSMR